MTATIRSVAEAAGVSITTVSFVLSNKHPQVDAISKDTCERVKACAAALGYSRKTTAAAHGCGRSQLIGILLQPPDDETKIVFASPYDLSLLSGTQKALFEKGYFLAIGSEYPKEDTESLDRMISAGVSGVIFRCPSLCNVKRAQELINNGIPAVAIFPSERDHLYPCSVDMDNFKAGQLAGELFVKAGRKKPLYISAGSNNRLIRERAGGFCEAIKRELGKEPAGFELPNWEITPSMAEIVKGLSHSLPDAVLCTDSGSAFLTSLAAERMGISVPDDLAIIGFDCYAIRGAHQQRISSIGASWWEAGQVAAEGIIDRICNVNDWTEPKIVEPRFVWGHTTPPELAEGYPLPWTV